MSNPQNNIVIDCHSHPARQVQNLLAECGVNSIFCPVDAQYQNDDLPEAVLSGTFCGNWRQCCRQALDSFQADSKPENNFPTACPGGHLMTAIPVRRRRQTIGILICCLKNLKLNKNDSLQQLCSKMGVDSTQLITRDLENAVSGPRSAGVLEKILENLIEKIQITLENRNELEALSNSLTQSYEELNLLHRISDGMKITQPPHTFFTNLCSDLIEVVNAQKLLVFWTDQNNPVGPIHKVITPGEPQLAETEIRLIWQRLQTQCESNSNILIDSNVDRPYQFQWPRSIHNLVGVPIRRNENIMGALVALNKISKPDFDSIDTKLLMSLANESAVYLENSRLYRDLQELLIGALRALTSSIDAKDPYTCGHSERVAYISRWIAEHLSLNNTDTHNVYLAGLLHDIGKIGVSESVLRKPGKLTSQEFEQINRHPQIGSNILGGIKQMEDVTPAVLSHHEHFDGSGYPCGVRGKNIPLSGRIVKLADAFDAMTSDRTYRKALPRTAALVEIRRFSGTQFDPQLAEVFLNSNIDQLTDQLETVKITQETSDFIYQQILN